MLDPTIISDIAEVEANIADLQSVINEARVTFHNDINFQIALDRKQVELDDKRAQLAIAKLYALDLTK